MPNINLEIPEDVHKQLKLKAVIEEKTLKEIIIATLSKGGNN